jgi:hypothetical protein
MTVPVFVTDMVTLKVEVSFTVVFLTVRMELRDASANASENMNNRNIRKTRTPKGKMYFPFLVATRFCEKD